MTIAAGMHAWDTLLRFAPLIMPVAVSVGGLLAFLGVVFGLRQKARHDDWWNRMEWALTTALEGKEVQHRKIGIRLVHHLGHRAKGRRDREMYSIFLTMLTESLLEEQARGQRASNPEGAA